MTVPLPSFTVGAANYVEALADRKRKQTLEVIQAVRSDGWVRVVNTWIPVTGKVQLRSGQSVAVMWKNGTPQVAMMNQARRGGGDTPMVQVVLGVVEELWKATRADGVVDLWFRNYDQVVPLQLDRFGITPNDTIVWGPANDRILVGSGSGTFFRYHILKFAREPFTPFNPGQDAAAALTFERTENPFASGPIVGSVGGVNISGANRVGTATYLNTVLSENAVMTVSGSIGSSQLDDEGNLILVWSIQVTGTAKGVAQGPPASLRKFEFANITQRFTVVVDNTRSLVLLSTLTSPSLVGVLAGVTSASTIDFGEFAGAIVVSGGVAYAPGAFPSRQFINLSPILVTARDGVRGWVAEVVQHTLCASSSLDGSTPVDCTVVLGTAPFVARAGLVVKPPEDALAALAPLPMQGTFGQNEPGTTVAATYKRAVYRRTVVSGFFPGSIDAGGSDSPGFVIRFSDGIVKEITATLRAIGQRGVHILPTDFAYVLDDAVVDQPTGAPVNFFLDAWTFDGATVLTGATATSELPEDTDLTDVAILADFPEGVTRPKGGSGVEAAVQIVNSEGLVALGRFVEIP